jgi:hypothetical protein
MLDDSSQLVRLSRNGKDTPKVRSQVTEITRVFHRPPINCRRCNTPWHRARKASGRRACDYDETQTPDLLDGGTSAGGALWNPGVAISGVRPKQARQAGSRPAPGRFAIRGRGQLQNLSRRHLQELRENSALENNLQPQGARGAGLRRLPRPGQGACGGGR